MIVVATEDFEIYHGVVAELRERGATFTTIEPDEPLPERTSVVVTGSDHAATFGAGPGDGSSGGDDVDRVADETDDESTEPAANGNRTGGTGDDVTVVVADPDDPRRAVDRALALLRGDSGKTIVGVDPGRKPGIAVLADGVVVAAFQVPLSDAVEVVQREVADAPDPVVRVGDGSRLRSATLVNDLEDVRVELVDETGTTPYLGTGTRGMGDVLAAVNIARLDGEVVEEREVEPTAGELQVIKDRSREQSETNRAIDEVLARRVASGDLTIEEALAEHRDENGRESGTEDGTDGPDAA